jgi:hypothetical protein
MKHRGSIISVAGAAVIVALLAAVNAGADCGSIPFSTPFRMSDLILYGLTSESSDASPDISFDPLEVVVYEPGQRGIILWNGVEETLLLSTEIRTSAPVSILEVIPFPSEPKVELGEFETFEKMQRLLIEKSMWTVASGGGVPGVSPPIDEAARVTFYQEMGAHHLAVVEVLNAPYFADWVMKFFGEQKAVNPKIDPKFIDVINDYLQRNHRWFVFDVIETSDRLQSRQPVQYRFASPHVYYPLEISTLETGKTKVDLLLLTKQPIEGYKDLTFAVDREKGVAVTKEELSGVSEEWAAFMGADSFTMQRVHIKGNIRELKSDFIVR